ncbi:MAG TPA: hypothetical protein VHV83_11330, partial [Armatimonadota bacterium]|nr:hypothetical protein [Armatimonadota bacterium]
MKFAADDWPEGKYELMTTLRSEKTGERLAVARSYVEILPPSDFEVGFDFDRTCYVNGQPFFPIGVYDVSKYMLDRMNVMREKTGIPARSMREIMTDVKSHGFNFCMMGDGFPSEEMMTLADELGLYLCPSGIRVWVGEIDDYLAQANRHRCVLAWYGQDEMSDVGDVINSSIDVYSRFRERDPHRPVISAFCNWNPALVERALKALDIMMPDPYPIPRFPITTVSDDTDTAARYMGNRAGLWMVLQSFPNPRVPTPEESRCMAYLAITHGAKGLIWYTLQCDGTFVEGSAQGWSLPDNPELWSFFKALNSEISGLAAPILQGMPVPEVSASPEIHIRALEYQGSLYIIAVNGTRSEVNAIISGVAGSGTCEVINEDRSVPVCGGEIKDSFQPLGVHIYDRGSIRVVGHCGN